MPKLSAHILIAAVLIMMWTGQVLGQDAQRGRHVFRKCATCHVTDPNSTALLGPPLHDVLGRPAAATPGFEYSDIMKEAGRKGLRWTKQALFFFLDRPDVFMPGTYMAFAGLEEQERLDVIAYLEELGLAYEKSNPKRTDERRFQFKKQ